MTELTKYDILNKPLIPGCKWDTRPRIARLKKRQGLVFMFAVIETGGKQYKVQKDDVVFVEKLAAEKDSTVQFPVLAVVSEDGTKFGTPYVEGATVTAKVLKEGKGKKITVFTYKPKKNEKRKMGHRQPYTKVQIVEINA
ncbi:MAG: 50S ribosomal protein L21 [Oscillospiraceae bacterium]